MSRLCDLTFINHDASLPVVYPPMKGVKSINYLQKLSFTLQELLEYAARINFNNYIYWSTHMVKGKIVNWNILLKIACEECNLELACYCANKGANNWDEAMVSISCTASDIDIAEWILAQKPSSLERCKMTISEKAHAKGDLSFLNWLQARVIVDLDYMGGLFIGACASGNMELVSSSAALVCSQNLIGDGYREACNNGHLEIVKFLDAKYSVASIHCAFRGGHDHIINHVVSKFYDMHIYPFGTALRGAIDGRQKKLIESILNEHESKLVLMDPFYWEFLFRYACTHAMLRQSDYYVKKHHPLSSTNGFIQWLQLEMYSYLTIWRKEA